MLYKGDLVAGINPAFARPAGGLLVRWNGSNAAAVKVSALYGTLHADDARSNDRYAKQRNLKFTSQLLELSLQGEYNFLNYRNAAERQGWSPYLFLGVGYYRFSPQDAPNAKLPYSTQGVSIPFGVGLKWVLRYQWNMGLEFGARKTFSDYLDGLGGEEPVPVRLANGNPYANDMYFFTGLTISYTFYGTSCPDF